jgi:hypothetical protein
MFNKSLIIGILLVGATFSISANEVQQWEYKCVEIDPNIVSYVAEAENVTKAVVIETTFNGLGFEGWEMVGYGVRRQTLWNHLTLSLSDTFLPVTSPV